MSSNVSGRSGSGSGSRSGTGSRFKGEDQTNTNMINSKRTMDQDVSEQKGIRIRIRAPASRPRKGRILNEYTTADTRIKEKLRKSLQKPTKTPLEDVPFEMTKMQRYSMEIPQYLEKVRNALNKKISGWLDATKTRNILKILQRFTLSTEDNIYLPKMDHKIQRVKRHFPYFTYWVSSLHVMVYMASVAVFGVADWGVTVSEITTEVSTPNSRGTETQTYHEGRNVWIGPSEQTLVLLGGRYPPCMRNITGLQAAWNMSKLVEGETGCCVNRGGSACYQTLREKCPANESHFRKWSPTMRSQLVPASPHDDIYRDGGTRRTKGPVCGLDPKFCDDPISLAALNHEKWPNDFTEWPVCKKTYRPTISGATVLDPSTLFDHMYCSLQTRPCCYGIRGKCIMATWEFCELLEGTFHSEANLCSQTRCFEDICGFRGFINDYQPDQWYRLLLTLAIHRGLVDLGVTLVFQLCVMSDLERVISTKRTAFIYIVSGVLGNMAAAVFLPLTVKVGPSASLCGILAGIQTMMMYNYPQYHQPKQLFLTSGCTILAILVFGFLPFMDAWANGFGFLFGFLVYLFGAVRRGKCVNTCCKQCLLRTGLVFITLCIAVFLTLGCFVFPIEPQSWFEYLECIPFTESFCALVDPIIGVDTSARNVLYGELQQYIHWQA